jgi:hypothetical protein
MFKIKIPFFLLSITIVFILTGCSSSKDIPKNITINENDVREIRTWGNEEGRNEVVLNKSKSSEIIKWVNSAKIIKEAKLPPEMKAPHSEITIYLNNNKVIQIFMFGEDLIIDSYKADQKNLTEFLKQNAR